MLQKWPKPHNEQSVSPQIAGLNATKDQLTKEAEAFQAAVDAAKEEAAAEVRA